MSAVKRDYEKLLNQDPDYITWTEQRLKENIEALDQDVHYQQQQQQQQQEEEAQQRRNTPPREHPND